MKKCSATFGKNNSIWNVETYSIDKGKTWKRVICLKVAIVTDKIENEKVRDIALVSKDGKKKLWLEYNSKTEEITIEVD